MIGRRQFNLWAGSMLLVGPAALAGPEPRTAGKGDSAVPSGLAALVFTAELAGRVEDSFLPNQVAVRVHASNRGRAGISPRIDIADVTVEREGTRTGGLTSWMNDSHPFARRISPPAFVDLPAGKRTLVGIVHAGLPEGLRDPKGSVLRVSLRLWDGDALDAPATTVELPPIPLGDLPDNT